MSIPSDSRGWYSIDRYIDTEVIQRLMEIGLIERLSLTKIPLITVKSAQRLSCLKVERLWLWCDVTPRAMRHVIQLPGLRVLDVLRIRGPGKLVDFGKAQDLEVFRANYGMAEADLLQVAQCVQLRELGVQNADISLTSLSALLSLPNLTSLDLEATRFDDRMAKRTSRSKAITSLDLGATRITRAGLEHLTRMEQLRSLDLWATDIHEADLKLLLNLPNLEYLSLGNYDGLPSLDSNEVTQLLLELPSLKRVWLDGIQLEATQKKEIEDKLESVRITSLSGATNPVQGKQYH